MARRTLPGGPPASLTAQRSELVVFACGDPAHAEYDSVAIAACTGLPPGLLERIDLKIAGALRPEYLRDLAAGTRVVIADTIPGTPEAIIEAAFADLAGREEPLHASSTPQQSLDELVAMAQLLRAEPLSGRVVALRTDAVDLTAAPDPRAVDRLREAVARTLRELAG